MLFKIQISIMTLSIDTRLGLCVWDPSAKPTQIDFIKFCLNFYNNLLNKLDFKAFFFCFVPFPYNLFQYL